MEISNEKGIFISGLKGLNLCFRLCWLKFSLVTKFIDMFIY